MTEAVFGAPIKSLAFSAQDGLPQDLLSDAEPCVLKGFVKHWPVVQAAMKSAAEGAEYLQDLYNHQPVHLMRGEASIRGRLFYNDDMSGFNFTRSNVNLTDVLGSILNAEGGQDAPTFYVGSTAVDHILPEFRTANPLPSLDDKALVSIWLGNRSRISAHYDAPDNIACVTAGRRRFTLFPPEQIDNLYVGPLDFTPAGQPASLVDFHRPDLQRFPRFVEAQKHALVAELEPGDAIYIPSMWWHHVEGLSDFNVLVNYWWRQVPNFIGVPGDALQHALLSIRDLPASQRQAWKKFFDHYVFEPSNAEHIPQSRRGMLDTLDNQQARKLRASLVNKLNR